jgi:lambda family phage portal protein
MNIIDKAISFVNPKAGAERMRSRYLIKLFEDQERKFDAASRGRRTANWQASSSSINTEATQFLHTLRARSRDMVQNNGFAKRAVNGIARNTVGAGIRPTPITESAQKQKRVKQAWATWAESTECDFDGNMNIYGLQRLAMKTVVESGEVIIRRRRNAKGSIPFQLQVCEPDFIDTNKQSLSMRPGEPFILNGIEFDRDGRKVAYWLYDSHPGENLYVSNYDSKRVPVEEIIHVYYVDRPGQVRGIPFGAPSLLRLKDFDEYEDAQLVRQKIAACFSVFITETSDGSFRQGGDTDKLGRVEPGIIEYLSPGQQVSFATPPAAEGYSEYSAKILQSVAAGFETTYEILTGDLSNVNFSSGRMGWLEFHRSVEDWQENMMIPQFCNKVWSWFMLGMELKGLVGSYVPATWTAPRREMIDPVKETDGMNKAVSNGFQSWSETVRQQGYSPDEVLAEISDERKKFAELGIKLAWEEEPKPQTGIPQQNNQE